MVRFILTIMAALLVATPAAAQVQPIPIFQAKSDVVRPWQYQNFTVAADTTLTCSSNYDTTGYSSVNMDYTGWGDVGCTTQFNGEGKILIYTGAGDSALLLIQEWGFDSGAPTSISVRASGLGRRTKVCFQGCTHYTGITAALIFEPFSSQVRVEGAYEAGTSALGFTVAPGSASKPRPVLGGAVSSSAVESGATDIGRVYTLTARPLGTDATSENMGVLMITGMAADGSATDGYPVLIGGTDGTNAQTLKTDTSGNLGLTPAANAPTGSPTSWAVSTTTANITALTALSCGELRCNVAVAFKVGDNAVTAATSDNDLNAGEEKRFCLVSGQTGIAAITSSGTGTCKWSPVDR